MEWINVNDELPEDDEQSVLISCIEESEPVIGFYDGLIWYVYNYGTIIGVTHWMPLPEPPKEK